MNINKLNISNQVMETNKKESNQPVKKEEPKTNKKEIYEEKPAALYEKNNQPKVSKQIYSKEAILKLKQETENNKLKIIKLINDSLSRQNKAFSLQNMPEEIINIDDQARKEAEALIGEDGELGVEKTSQRLVDFAISLSGGDTSKAETLRRAIDKGFDEARKMFGGKLPQISEDTYKATMEKFDAWVNENKSN